MLPEDIDAYLGFIETKIVSEEKVPSRASTRVNPRLLTAAEVLRFS